MTLKNELDKLGNHFPHPPKAGPGWDGPESSGPNGGVTFSLLGRFLTCRERFRLYAVEGLQPAATFNHRIEYGNMWHVCEEYAGCQDASLWKRKLEVYTYDLLKRFPLDREKILHWHRVCVTQYPIYHLHWNFNNKTEREREYIFREKVFNVAYPLPSGRVARLRGKWDGLFRDARHGTLWLQENKTKGDVDEQRIRRQLRFDLQTMLYLVALEASPFHDDYRDQLHGTVGVLYSVVRRPLSGGKHTIVRHKPTKANPAGESEAAFYERLGGLIRDDPQHYFLRLNVEVTARDRESFCRTCLDPLLEHLCDWWEALPKHSDAWSEMGEGTINRLHWRHPYGVYNPLDDGGFSDLDAHLETGSRVGLRVVDTLFPELA